MIFSLRHTARAAALAAACCGGWLALSASPTAADPPSWVFAPGTYSHDPYTGARVAQYYRTPPVEPLPDTRMVTSRYRRTRTNLRGTNGSVDTEYQVRAWANGRGGLDAEWERFHDAWQESIYQGSYFNSSSGYGFGGPGFGGRHRGFGGPGYWT